MLTEWKNAVNFWSPGDYKPIQNFVVADDIVESAVREESEQMVYNIEEVVVSED